MQTAQLQKIFEAFSVKTAYLFGSQVTGKTHAESDVDIAVRFRKKITLKKRLELDMALTKFFKKSADVIDLDAADLRLQFRIYKARSLLYSENRKEEVITQAKAMNMYHDYKYYYDRYQQQEMRRILVQGLA